MRKQKWIGLSMKVSCVVLAFVCLGYALLTIQQSSEHHIKNDSQIEQVFVDGKDKNEDSKIQSVLKPDVEGTYQVMGISDADTLTILWGDEERDVQLIGITPLMYAKEELERLLVGDMVMLEFDNQQRDEEGVWQAYVYRADGIMLNRQMLRCGAAKCKNEKENIRYKEEFRLDQETAQARQAGSWSGEKPEADLP